MIQDLSVFSFSKHAYNRSIHEKKLVPEDSNILNAHPQLLHLNPAKQKQNKKKTGEKW